MKALCVAICFLFASPAAGLEEISFFEARPAKTPVTLIDIRQEGNQADLYVEGYLPNTCYGEPRAEVRRGKSAIYVDIIASVSGQNCAEVAKLFDMTVELGAFNPGVYRAVVQRATSWERIETFEVD